MELSVDMVVIDCEDAQALAEFWAAALGTEAVPDTGDLVVLEGRPRLGFQQVEDPTPGKNRLHLELFDSERTRVVARLVELGVDVVRTHDVDGFCWTVMKDPEGMQFCVSDPWEPAGGPYGGGEDG